MTDRQVVQARRSGAARRRDARGRAAGLKNYGRLDQDKSNAILYPTSYSAQHDDIDRPIGEDRSCHLLTRRTKLVRCLLWFFCLAPFRKMKDDTAATRIDAAS